MNLFINKPSLYGIIIIILLITNIIIISLIYKKYNFTKDEVIGALVYENIGIIFGAKLLTYLEHFNYYIKFDFLKT